MKKLLLSLMFLLPMLGNAAKKPYSLTWNDFNIKDDTGLMVLGQINTLTPAIDMDSRWSIGCECLDRDYADFDSIRDFYGGLQYNEKGISKRFEGFDERNVFFKNHHCNYL